jgi:hypothetical protein
MPEPEKKLDAAAKPDLAAKSHVEAKPDAAAKSEVAASSTITMSREQARDMVQDAVAGAIKSLTSQAPATQVQQPEIEPEVTDAEVQAALDAGDAKKVRELNARTARRAVQQESARTAPVQSAAIASLNSVVAERLTTKKHYGKFKDELNAELGKVPANIPRTYELMDNIYAYVVGRHAEELEQEVQDRTLRAAREEGAVAPGSAGRAAAGGAPGDEKPEDVFGTLALDAFKIKGRRKGRDLNGEARSLGYENAQAWMKKSKEYDARSEVDASLGLDK